jgi:hypothetical protein
VEFLKNTIIYNKQSESSFSTQLKNDINLLATKRDMLYVSNFLVPMLNSEAAVNVCLHPFDSLNRRWMIEGKKIVLYAPRKQLLSDSQLLTSDSAGNETDPLNNANNNTNASSADSQINSLMQESLSTKAFSKQQRAGFFGALQKLTEKTGLLQTKLQKGGWQLAAQQASDSQPAMLEKVMNKVLKQAPFLIIMEGTNTGRPCVTGVFSSQPLNEMS